MTKLALLVRYVLPGAIVGGILVYCATLTFGHQTGAGSETINEVLGPANGYCLIAVVEPDGVYVGTTCIPIEQFAEAFESTFRQQKPKCAIVLGSQTSRYGDAVKVYATLYIALNGRVTLDTLPIRPGTRLKPFENVHGWFLPDLPESVE